jgi:hypothetical protein
MDSYTNEQEPSQAEIQLDEPHFDETTLLSARPVVPLEVVEAKSRSINRLLIGSAIVLALLVGVLGATFIYKSRGGTQTTRATASENTPAQSGLVVEAGIVGGESQEIEQIAESEEPTIAAESEETEPAVSNQKPNERPVIKNARATSPPVISRQPRPERQVNRPGDDEADYGTLEEDIVRQRELDKEIRRAERREERRAQRREERRPRRVEKEAKHQGGDSAADDLLRIREIFEGRPRP